MSKNPDEGPEIDRRKWLKYTTRGLLGLTALSAVGTKVGVDYHNGQLADEAHRNRNNGSGGNALDISLENDKGVRVRHVEIYKDKAVLNYDGLWGRKEIDAPNLKGPQLERLDVSGPYMPERITFHGAPKEIDLDFSNEAAGRFFRTTMKDSPHIQKLKELRFDERSKTITAIFDKTVDFESIKASTRINIGEAVRRELDDKICTEAGWGDPDSVDRHTGFSNYIGYHGMKFVIKAEDRTLDLSEFCKQTYKELIDEAKSRDPDWGKSWSEKMNSPRPSEDTPSQER